MLVTIRYKVNCDLSMRNASPCCPCSSRWASTFSAMPPRRVLPALPNRPNGQRHRSARHQSIGQRGALNREALVRALSRLIMRRGGFTMSIVAWVTLTVPVCLARTQSYIGDSRWGGGTLRRGSGAGLLVSHRRRHRDPSGASVFRVQDPGESSTRLLSGPAALLMNIAPCPECA